ncbi:MAG: hypothetical protein B0W54_02110 [Cellvibrio sp. 79]|nr:MAG: hypothetical protein B0W54_02110 [Cellvibrio sp. 79]
MNKFFLIMGLSGLATMATADNLNNDYRFYIDASFNRAFGNVDASDMNNRMAELGYEANASVSGQDRNAWDATFGYRLKDYLDLELGYTDLGTVRTNLSGNVVDINDYLNSANVVHPRSATGFNLALRGRFYLNDHLFLYGRAGVLWADSRYVATAAIEKEKRSKKDESFFGGIGVQYELNPRWSLHVHGSAYRIEDESIKALGLGIAYRFGADN